MLRSMLLMVATITMLMPATALAQEREEIAREIRRMIIDQYAYGRENLKDLPDTIAEAGSVDFWSSGGLIQRLAADAAPSEYSVNTLVPKHIRVMLLPGDQSAVVQMYAEGSVGLKGAAVVSHYLARATIVLVKEGGTWKTRASHYSPVTGGSGTNQVAP